MDAITKSFHWADYLIFISSLVIATGIGIFYTWKDKDKQTTSDFLLGGRKMGLLPVTLSLAATLSSGGLQMGIPAEVFYNGTMWIYIWVPNAFVFIFIARYVIPVYHDLQITSVYEYLEMRFNRGIRIVGCIIFVIQTLLNMALTLYAPALALNQVMGIDMLVSIVLIGLVCTFYTAIGGLKAVMWTDVFQTLVIFVGLISLIVLATIDAGGISVVYETASKAGKVELDNFNPSPFQRHTFWTLFIGGFTTTLGIYGTNQSMVQRFVSMEKIKGAQTVWIGGWSLFWCFLSLLEFPVIIILQKEESNVVTVGYSNNKIIGIAVI